MRFIVFALAALVALSVFAIKPVQQPVEAAPVEFTVELTGAKENPPVNIGGSAVAKLSFDDDTNLLTYTITVSGVPQNQVTAAHIHQGGAGTNGPIRHTLSEYGFTQLGPASVTLNSADEDLLKKGELYLNIHSNTPDCGTCASGFARGQMIVPGTPGATRGAPTPPAQEVRSPNTGEGALTDSDTGAGWTAVAVVAALVLVPGLFVLARRRS
jgi:CHRD domain